MPTTTRGNSYTAFRTLRSRSSVCVKPGAPTPGNRLHSACPSTRPTFPPRPGCYSGRMIGTIQLSYLKTPQRRWKSDLGLRVHWAGRKMCLRTSESSLSCRRASAQEMESGRPIGLITCDSACAACDYCSTSPTSMQPLHTSPCYNERFELRLACRFGRACHVHRLQSGQLCSLRTLLCAICIRLPLRPSGL